LGLAILIACVGLSPEFSAAGVRNLRLEDFVLPALLLSWLGHALKDRTPFQPAVVTGPIILYFSVMVVSTIVGLTTSASPAVSGLLVLGKLVEYYLIYLLILNNVRSPEELRALVLFAICVAIAGAVLLSGGFVGSGAARFNGPAGETANIYGGYLILHVALAVGLYLQAPGPGLRLVCAAASVILGLVLLFTYSRTSFTAIGLAFLVFGVLKDRRLLVILLVAAIVFPFIAPATVWDRVLSIGGVAVGPTPGSWGSRLYAWTVVGGRTMAESPLFGLGVGAVPMGEVDNEYVLAFAQTGILGVGFFAWVLIRLLRRANSLFNDLPPQTFERGLAAGYAMALVAMIVHGVGATSFTTIRTMESFVVISGFWGALNARRAEWAAVPTVSPGGGTVLVASSPVLRPQDR
jgi:hypothetical protein